MSIIRSIKKSILESSAYRPPTGRKHFIKLDLNESHSVLNKHIIEKLKNFDAFVLSGYPEYGELTKKLAAYANVPADHIRLTNGSDHAIQLLVDLFFEKGRTAVVPSPVFFPYYHFLSIKEASITEVLYADLGTHFAFPVEAMLGTIDKNTSGVILCNPNNPLGSSIPEDDLKKIIEKTSECDIPLIIDEAYFEYSSSDATRYLGEYPHLIILRTFSKAFGLAGVRLGYVIAHPDVLNEFDKVRLAWSVNHYAVFAGTVVLGELSHFKEKIQEQKAVRRQMREMLAKKKITCYESDTNFLVAKHPNYAALIARLKAANILTQDISHYPHSGSLLANAFRISLPARHELDAVDAAL